MSSEASNTAPRPTPADRPLRLPPRQRRLAERLYRITLLLYPRRFRLRFADDLSATFLDLLADARVHRGQRGLAAAWSRGLADVVAEASKERVAPLRPTHDLPGSAPPGGPHMWDDFSQDIRLALRRLRTAPGYAAAAILTLALGIGANSAIFSIGSAALGRSAAVVEPERLAAVWTTCRAGNPRCSSSYPDYLDYRARSTVMDDLAAYTFERASLGDEDGARLVSVQASSGNYFELLGVETATGRLFGAEDEDELRAVAVLTADLWRDQYGSDPNIVGRTIRLNRAGFEVIGVTAEGFGGLHLNGSPDLFIPLRSGPALASGFFEDDSLFAERGSRWIDQLIGRLADGATIEQAQEEMLAISDQLAAEDPGSRGPRKITVESAHRLILPANDGGDLAGFVFMLGGIAAFTLLLTCANLANLLLARAAARRREISVRLAIGASKPRLARQMLTESMVLALLGGAASVLVGNWVLSLLAGYQLPGGVAVSTIDAGMDFRVLGFTFALALATGLVFGFVPTLQATRTDLNASLKASGRGATAMWTRLRGGLVAVQLALCLVLLTGSGLFLQALWNGLQTDLGFAAEGVAVASLDLSLLHYSGEDGRVFVDALVQRMESMPGVIAAGVGTRAPMLPGGTATMLQSVEGYQPADDEELRLEYAFVSDGYLRALGVPLLDGRPFTSADESGQLLMIVNREMAQRWWPERSAVGGRVAFYGDPPPMGDIVGVVENTKWDDGIAIADYPFAYRPLATSGGRWVGGRIAVVVRTSGSAAALLPVLRDEIATLEPDASLITLATMESLLSDVLMPQRMGAQLLSWFALLALVLAAVGIYSVVAYSVTQRRRDLGIRIALGAAARSIFAMVLGGVMGPVILGLIAGVGTALLLGRTVAGFMYGISPTDPLTITAVGAGLVVVAILASVVPAHRATRVDPVVALRAE